MGKRRPELEVSAGGMVRTLVAVGKGRPDRSPGGGIVLPADDADEPVGLPPLGPPA